MATFHAHKCRLCRREGEKLFLKGARCFTEKCAFERRGYAPGEHGKDRRSKETSYGLQLRMKQKTRRIYGILERQFRGYFAKAATAKGVTGEALLQMLERRLDNIVFRLGFAQSRRQSRQLVRHGHVTVNGKKVNIPSFEVSAGHEIAIRERSKKLAVLELAKEFASHGTMPHWLEVDRDNYKARVLALPKREDIQLPVNEQLIVELYSK